MRRPWLVYHPCQKPVLRALLAKLLNSICDQFCIEPARPWSSRWNPRFGASARRDKLKLELQRVRPSARTFSSP
jgi:hypothetical protein